MTRPRLTEADWETIRSALNNAIEERESYADAYSNTGPEAERAEAWVSRYEALHRKMFGRPSFVTQEREQMAKIPTVTIFELMSRKESVDEPED